MSSDDLRPMEPWTVYNINVWDCLSSCGHLGQFFFKLLICQATADGTWGFLLEKDTYTIIKTNI